MPTCMYARIIFIYLEFDNVSSSSIYDMPLYQTLELLKFARLPLEN